MDFKNLHSWNLVFCYLSRQLVLAFTCTHLHGGILMVSAGLNAAGKCRFFFSQHLFHCFHLSSLKSYVGGQVTYTGCILGKKSESSNGITVG